MIKRKVVGVVVALVVLGAGAAAVAVSGSSAVSVRVADVTKTDLTVTVSAAGSVGADGRVDVYPPTSGILASVEVTNGAFVHAGDVLAVMDTDAMSAQVAQAQAAYQGTIAQRDAVRRSSPSAADLKAVKAGVDAGYSAYLLTKAAYDAAVAGAGAPSPSDIANAQSQLAAAQAAAQAASDAYDDYYNDIYLPAPEPRDPALEGTLATLLLVKNQTTASLATAQQAYAAIAAGSDNSANIAQAKVARDQAYAAYLSALAQQEALSKAGGTDSTAASADAAVEAAAKALALARDVLARATIKAPVEGYVLFNTVSSSLASLTGSPASVSGPGAGMTVTPASALFSIVSFDTLAFSAQVDEADVSQVSPGMEATVILDALPGTEFATTVGSISKESATTLTGGTVFPVTLRLDTRGQMVLLGMNGSAEITVQRIADVLAMPVEALVEQDSKDHAFTVSDGRARRVEIVTGKMTDTLVQVVSGLRAGDQVIVSGVSGLADGDRVRVE